MTRLPWLLIPLLVACSASEEDDPDAASADDGADSDQDGLSDSREGELGSDPDNADTDQDGLADGVEVEQGSDPTNPFSWPGNGVWPDMRWAAEADGVDGDSYGRGEVFPNFSGVDAYGNEVELYQFYGSVILVDFAAMWCGPCKQVAAGAQEVFDAYRDDGFVIVHALTGDAQDNPPDEEDLATWSESFGLEFPVLGGNEPAQIFNTMYRQGLNAGGIPYMILLDQDMALDSWYTGSGPEEAAELKAKRLLGID